MPDLTQELLELVRLTSTNLPGEVEQRLRRAALAFPRRHPEL
mgnify:CR=1 FL=1